MVVVATLALGIGANTAIFEILDAVRLRTLPIVKPGELVAVDIVGGNRGFGVNDSTFTDFTVPMWQEVKEHHDPLSGVFAWRPASGLGALPSLAMQADSKSAEIFSMCWELFPCRAD